MSEIKRCPSCGSPLLATDKDYCGSCGVPFEGDKDFKCVDCGKEVDDIQGHIERMHPDKVSTGNRG